MCLLRRLILLWLFMFWQGGFLFYGAVVVTIGSEVHGDFAQGLITRQVALAMNLTGLCVLLAWIWDLLAERGSHWKRRWGCWIFLMLTIGVLAWLHPQMDALIDADHRVLLDVGQFRHLHRWYLRVSTTQWIASIIFTFWTLQAWRTADALSLAGRASDG